MTKKPIIMYTTTWCGDCKRSRKFLEDNHVVYKEINIEENDEAAALVERINNGYRSVPTILLSDGTLLVEPTNKALAEALSITSS